VVANILGLAGVIAGLVILHRGSLSGAILLATATIMLAHFANVLKSGLAASGAIMLTSALPLTLVSMLLSRRIIWLVAGITMLTYIVIAGIEIIVVPSLWPTSIEYPLFIQVTALTLICLALAYLVDKISSAFRISLQDLSAVNVSLQAELQERLRVETALRESEARYRRLADNLPDMVYRVPVRHQRETAYINPAGEKLTGYTPAELLAEPELWRRLIHPLDSDMVLRSLGVNGVLPNPSVFRVRHKSGRVVWMEVREMLLCDEAEMPTAVEGIARDITEQTLAANALRESEVRFRLIAEHAHDLICILELDTILLYVSPSFERMLQYNLVDLIGRSVFELIHPVDLETFHEHLAQAQTDGTTRITFRFLDLAGDAHWFDAIGTLAEYYGRLCIVLIGRNSTEDRQP
jgi:PAS domain S-box-containing protein